MNLTAIRAYFPGRDAEISRLEQLADSDRPPVVTVLGKFNHGKSSLLNELIGESVFAVSDARQTTQLDALEQDGVRWLDAPGLDADVMSEDDRLALRGTWEVADIRLFVHSVREGELDGSEQALVTDLAADATHSRRAALVVLTQIDQVDEATLANVERIVRDQVGALEVFPVSATRYKRGREDGKHLMIEKSGMRALKSRITQVAAHVHAARASELLTCCNVLRGHLAIADAALRDRLAMLKLDRNQMIAEFKREFWRLEADVHKKFSEV